MADESEIVVRRMSYAIPVSQEYLDDRLPPFPDMMRMIEENERAFRALPPEEQARILAERKAAYEADRCTECGCHPDEHGDR